MQIRLRKRLFIILLIVALIVVFDIGRLAWMQLVAPARGSAREASLVQASVNQRERGITLDSGRGHFVDREGRPITGQTVQALVVYPVNEHYRGGPGQMKQLAGWLQTSETKLRSFMSELKEPTVWPDAKRKGLPYALSERQAEEIRKLHIGGTAVMPMQIRYPASVAANQTIGYIGENPERLQSEFGDKLQSGALKLNSQIGAAGLEKTFNDILQGIGPTVVSHFTDGQKRPLHGLDLRVMMPDNRYYPLQVVTTLDLDVQRRIEAYLDTIGFTNGAVVVLDARSADVVATASRPGFDPYAIDLSAGSWGNKPIKAYPPGSIFKTVIAAAALGEGVAQPKERFECHGEYGKYGFSCWKRGGHGTLTFEEAFAQSCNVTFAKLAERLSFAQLRRYADMLGLGRTVGWRDESFLNGKPLVQWDGEEAGRIIATGAPNNDRGILVQTAIGQRDVLVTPLQAANLVVTLLNGGRVQAPRVVKEVRYANGQLMAELPPQTAASSTGRITSGTANRLLEWMELVVDRGTGRSLQGAKWRLAGKSGTAQTTDQGRRVNDQWFIGYGPVGAPRYAVAVVALNRPEQSAPLSQQAFRGVMDILAQQKEKSR